MQALQSLQDQQATVVTAVMPLLPLIQAIPLHIDAAKTSLNDSVAKLSTGAYIRLAQESSGIQKLSPQGKKRPRSPAQPDKMTSSSPSLSSGSSANKRICVGQEPQSTRPHNGSFFRPVTRDMTSQTPAHARQLFQTAQRQQQICTPLVFPPNHPGRPIGRLTSPRTPAPRLNSQKGPDSFTAIGSFSASRSTVKRTTTASSTASTTATDRMPRKPLSDLPLSALLVTPAQHIHRITPKIALNRTIEPDMGNVISTFQSHIAGLWPDRSSSPVGSSSPIINANHAVAFSAAPNSRQSSSREPNSPEGSSNPQIVTNLHGTSPAQPAAPRHLMTISMTREPSILDGQARPRGGRRTIEIPQDSSDDDEDLVSTANPSADSAEGY
ncbi:hypothetical protein BDQ12DRAFT_681760 [Crucibulum laeve]|uniref:Uncharacterized protein n=1 Tax=Crucibulum laeve TaxID=68775 RepID=A0A5C3M210_9AGAR|nr:hypothetical protein BDQ12DRAFT_681760 [Crucibulum laeve]